MRSNHQQQASAILANRDLFRAPSPEELQKAKTMEQPDVFDIPQFGSVDEARNYVSNLATLARATGQHAEAEQLESEIARLDQGTAAKVLHQD